MNRICWPIIAAYLLLGGAPNAWAQSPNVGRWYTVELILFEQRLEDNDNETWHVLPSFAAESQQLMVAAETLLAGLLPATELVTPPELPTPWPRFNLMTGLEEPYVLIPRPLLTLSAEAQRINQSRGRRLLLHVGWHMPMPGEQAPQPVRLWSGPQYGNLHRIDGSLSFYVGRFLHVDANLFWTEFGLEPAPAPNWLDPERVYLNTWQVPQALPKPPEYSPLPQFIPRSAVHFNEQRRMRSNELHYLDHPRLGLLIQFTPYTPIEVEPSLLLIEPNPPELDLPAVKPEEPSLLFDFGTPLQNPVEGFVPVMPRPFEERDL